MDFSVIGKGKKKRQPTIRPAHGNDAETIAQLYIASWNMGFRGLMPQREMDDDLVTR